MLDQWLVYFLMRVNCCHVIPLELLVWLSVSSYDREITLSIFLCSTLSIPKPTGIFAVWEMCRPWQAEFPEAQVAYLLLPTFSDNIFQTDVCVISVIAVRKRRWTSYQLAVEW